MQQLYNLFIFLFSVGIKLASFFNPKAKLFIDGRKNVYKKKLAHKNVYWFHCASLGEFEQGRPVIEELKKRKPEIAILLTFFSPSGYEVQKNYALADHVMYLPIDTRSNAKKFLETFKPDAAFFIKYEFWFNYLSELKSKNIPTYLISGIFRKEHYFFKWYGKWFLNKLKTFNYFFLQHQTSLELLKQHGFNNALVNGDTRFDRVIAISAEAKKLDIVSSFKSNQKLLIAGSTWPEDEKMIFNWLKDNKECKVIIAPHNITFENISQITQLLDHTKINYSKFSENQIKVGSRVLIIDNIGMLSSLYRYGDIAYVGGGFGKSVHNILEAAVYGIPVLFGPIHHKFNEANELVRLTGGFVVGGQQTFNATINDLLSNEGKRKIAGGVCRKYVNENAGATEKIMNLIK